MEFFIIFDLTIFIILAILLLVFGLSIISDIETFVSKNMDTVLTIAVIIALIIAIVIFFLAKTINKRFKLSNGLLGSVLSLVAASQLVFYLYYSLTGIAEHGTLSRVLLFILFLVYGIINIGVYLYANFWILVAIDASSCRENKLCGYLAPILVCAVGWFVNAIITGVI